MDEKISEDEIMDLIPLDKQDEREISRAYEELKNLLNEIEGEQEF